MNSSRLRTALLTALAAVFFGASSSALFAAGDTVIMRVDVGGTPRTILIELDDANTPQTALNFKKLCAAGYYNGTVFHRVIPGYIIQAGDPLSKDPAQAHLWGTGGPGFTIPPELGQPHFKGSLAMARLNNDENSSKESSGSQFYIALNRLEDLDGEYTVFGKVVQGLEYIDDIANTPTDENNVPVERVEILSTRVLSDQPVPALDLPSPEMTSTSSDDEEFNPIERYSDSRGVLVSSATKDVSLNGSRMPATPAQEAPPAKVKKQQPADEMASANEKGGIGNPLKRIGGLFGKDKNKDKDMPEEIAAPPAEEPAPAIAAANGPNSFDQNLQPVYLADGNSEVTPEPTPADEPAPSASEWKPTADALAGAAGDRLPAGAADKVNEMGGSLASNLPSWDGGADSRTTSSSLVDEMTTEVPKTGGTEIAKDKGAVTRFVERFW